MKEETDPREKGHKKKTKHNDIHKDQLRWHGRKCPSLGTSGEYAHCPVESSSTNVTSKACDSQKSGFGKGFKTQQLSFAGSEIGFPRRYV
jgi:hypothetical protein